MKRRYKFIRYGLGVAGVTLLVVGCGNTGGNSSNNSGNKAQTGKKYTITVQLQANTGAANSKNNKALVSLAKKYEKSHPDVTVKFLPNPYTDISKSNAVLLTKASGGKAPDVVWEQYGQADSGAIPKGILLNLKPYLNQSDPYAGGKKWSSTWPSSVIPYMQASNGNDYILLGSFVATEIVYNKQDFKKAGITNAPKTFQGLLSDLKKLKSAGFQPLMFSDANGQCNPSWYERTFSSELLHSYLSKFNVNHAKVASGLDTAVGIKKGIISMNNPAYAEGWKLLGELRPYMAPGGSTYDACASVNASSPPLSPDSPFIQGKYAMFYSGSWAIPQLTNLGMNSSKFGFFPFPTITKSTTKYSSNISVQGVVGGPNGTGEWSVTTKKADNTMTKAKTKQVINFLEYLYAPKNEGQWVQNAGSGSYIPVIKGAKYSGVKGIKALVPSTTPPTTIEGVLSGALTNKAHTQGARIIQNYLSGNLSFSKFAKQWESVLQQGAKDWAKSNNKNLSKY